MMVTVLFYYLASRGYISRIVSICNYLVSVLSIMGLMDECDFTEINIKFAE